MSKSNTVIKKFMQNMDEREFIETFFSVIDKQRKELPFKFNVVQNIIYDNMGKKNVILKYRKPGASLLVQCLFLARCLLRKNRNCVILSFDKESTQRMLERTEWILNHLPFKVDLERNSKNEFKIKETNSKLFIGVAGSKAFGRGDDVTDVHISELAWWENDSIVTGLLEALTDDSQVFVESTANGSTNMYAKLCRKAQKASKESDWKFHFFPWHIDPALEVEPSENFSLTEEEKEIKTLYSLNDKKIMWRRKKMEDMLEPELFPQEYPACIEEAFLVLADCIFNKKAIMNYKQYCSLPAYVGEINQVGMSYKFQQNPDGNLKIWASPTPGTGYRIVVDASDPERKSSKRGDPACIQVIKTDNLEQVAVWSGYEEPFQLGRLAFNIGIYYNTGEMVVERNNQGISTIDCLRTLNYPNLYKMLDVQYGVLEETERVGWITNLVTRPLIIGALQDAISNQLYIVHDPDTVAELSSFVRNRRDGKIGAASGTHDDRVITLGIAAYLHSITPKMMQTNEDQSYMDRKRMDWRSTGLSTFGSVGRGGY